MNQRTNSKNPPRVEFQVHFQTGYRGRRHLRKGASSKEPEHLYEDLPRLTRLLALAHRWNHLIEEGVVANHAEIARMMGLSRARVTQIMGLLNLAPYILEEIFFLKRGEKAEPAVPERAIRQIIQLPLWNDQRILWRKLQDERFHLTKGLEGSNL